MTFTTKLLIWAMLPFFVAEDVYRYLRGHESLIGDYL